MRNWDRLPLVAGHRCRYESMWKAALLLVLLFVAGHFAVRYLRTNPLDPVIEGGELIVDTSEHQVRFGLEGAFEGTYLVARAESEDWSDVPANASLSVVGLAATKDYLRAHPERHAYGSVPDLQLENLAAPLEVIAANRLVYGELRGLLDRHEERVQKRGKWLCLSISGEALTIRGARSLGNGSDSTASFVRRTGNTRSLLATRVSVEDCDELLTPG